VAGTRRPAIPLRPGVPGKVALGAPEIVTDYDGAAEYAKLKLRLTRSEAP